MRSNHHHWSIQILKPIFPYQNITNIAPDKKIASQESNHNINLISIKPHFHPFHPKLPWIFRMTFKDRSTQPFVSTGLSDPKLSLETPPDTIRMIHGFRIPYQWAKFGRNGLPGINTCWEKFQILRSSIFFPLGFQTPGEKVFGPQKHTIQTPNLRRSLEDSGSTQC